MLRCDLRCVSKPAIFAGFRAFRSATPLDQSPTCISRACAPVREAAGPEELPHEERSTSIGVKDQGPIVTGMAGRYATALFELGLEGKALDAVKADLDRFDAMLAQSADLLRLVRSPVFSADEQVGALSAVLDRAGIGGLSANFLKAVTANRRLFAVRTMIEDFRVLVADHKGELRADVTLAETPSERQLASIKEALGAVTRKDVQVDVRIDPSIIGGIVVKVGSRMVDASLRTKLNSLKQVMKEVS